MNKTSFRNELVNSKKEGFAMAAFNIFNYTSAKAVIRAAEELSTPIIIQTSTQTVCYYGAEELSKMLHGLMDSAKVNVYLHLDHCTSIELAKECIDAGWDAVMIDASKESIDKNIQITKEIVEYAHKHGVDVEGELGTIEGVEDDIQSDTSQLASFEECLRYVTETGIDVFAPALGTAHGVYKGTPKIDFHLADQLTHSLKQPIVVHGGSGLSEEVFQQLVKLGVSKINISTALKHAYIDGCKKYLAENSDKYAPLEVDGAMFEELKAVAIHHIKIFKN